MAPVGTNTVPFATAAGSLIAAPTGVDQSMAPVAGSTAWIVPFPRGFPLFWYV